MRRFMEGVRRGAGDDADGEQRGKRVVGLAPRGRGSVERSNVERSDVDRGELGLPRQQVEAAGERREWRALLREQDLRRKHKEDQQKNDGHDEV